MSLNSVQNIGVLLPCPSLPLYYTPPLPPILSSFCCLPLTICLRVSSHPPAVQSCSLCIHASHLAQSSWASDLIKTFKEQLKTFTDLRAAQWSSLLGLELYADRESVCSSVCRRYTTVHVSNTSIFNTNILLCFIYTLYYVKRLVNVYSTS